MTINKTHLTTTIIRNWPINCFQMTCQLFWGLSLSNHVVEQKGPEAWKVKTDSKAQNTSSPLMVVISLILARRWTCIQVRELSISISYRSRSFHRDTQHEYSSVPQHASPQHFLSLAHISIKTPKHPQPQGVSHVCDSHFTGSSKCLVF